MNLCDLLTCKPKHLQDSLFYSGRTHCVWCLCPQGCIVSSVFIAFGCPQLLLENEISFLHGLGENNPKHRWTGLITTLCCFWLTSVPFARRRFNISTLVFHGILTTLVQNSFELLFVKHKDSLCIFSIMTLSCPKKHGRLLVPFPKLQHLCDRNKQYIKSENLIRCAITFLSVTLTIIAWQLISFAPPNTAKNRIFRCTNEDVPD